MSSIRERLYSSWLWVALIQAVEQLRLNARRSLLTALGIIIAVAGAIAIIGVMQGAQENIRRALANLGSETIFIRANNFKVWGLGILQTKALTRRELDALNQNITNISNVAMIDNLQPKDGAEVSYKGNRYSLSGFNAYTIKASSPFLPEITHRYPIQGRYIAQSDDNARLRVCLISTAVQQQLKLPDRSVGEYIEIAGYSFRIIGIMPALKIDKLHTSADIYVPLSANEYLGSGSRPDMVFTLKNPDERAVTIQRIENLLRQSMKTPRTEIEDFVIEDVGEIKKASFGILETITKVLLLVVSVSLVVGGIGIMNVMLAAVTERTHEIGILRAIGANSEQIRAQFLIEAALLAGFGAAIGVILGFGLAHFALLFTDNIDTVIVPLWGILASVLVAVLVGVLSGYAPASRAAKLDPIIALTHV